MRILHIGWGFAPWRPGGLILYAEDLMRSQAAAGHEVSYFFSGRHYPIARRPRLNRWEHGPVDMYEVVNPPIVAGLEAGTRRPDLDLAEPFFEDAFRDVLTRVDPDVVHVQELFGLPSSLLEIAADRGVSTLMTLQDYGPLCTTLRLFDADGRICMRRDVGADCVARNARAPSGPEGLIADTVVYEVFVARSRGRIPAAVRRPLEGAVRRVYRPTRAGAISPRLGSEYQRRREVNIERLRRVDRLIAQSPRVGAIYTRLGVDAERITTMPFTLRHIEELRPRALDGPPERITFATLNGCASSTKGSRVVVDALRRLRDAGLEDRFRLIVAGWLDGEVADELRSLRSVEVRGQYRRDELSSMLDEVDVGLIPSIWEEALGYTGLEMLAKGIPLIANPLGGIVEYARNGETAWLNSPCNGEGLAERMQALIADPQQIVDMHRRVVAARDNVITSWSDHVTAIEGHYRAIAAA